MSKPRKYNLTFVVIWGLGIWLLFTLLWWWVAFLLSITIWAYAALYATMWIAGKTFDDGWNND